MKKEFKLAASEENLSAEEITITLCTVIGDLREKNSRNETRCREYSQMITKLEEALLIFQFSDRLDKLDF